jgi:UDP-N-acetylmuramyl pentapeptide phosphotransferase/UDP-N-acetylglucosamine-1-phosphate transferase
LTPIEFLVVGFGLIFGVAGTAFLTSRYQLYKINFRGDRIPSICGIGFLLYAAVVYAYEWSIEKLDPAPAAAFLIVSVGFGILGVIDDTRGDRKTGGLKGHFSELMHGRLSTGAIKAIGGAMLGLVVSTILHPRQPFPIVVGGALIALTANALNLLDLRPGRCLFGFLIGAAIISGILFSRHLGDMGMLLYLAVIGALVLYPLDGRGLLMIGDTGSNAFGATLGLAGALYYDLAPQIICVVLLLLFHLWTERNSLTAFIERHPVLRHLDALTGIR